MLVSNVENSENDNILKKNEYKRLLDTQRIPKYLLDELYNDK
jgi:hypothetical protein